MARSKWNRRVAVIVALAGCLALGPQWGSSARAAAVAPEYEAGDRGGSGTNNPGHSGDPDLPVGPSRTTRVGAQSGTTMTLRARPVGDGAVSSNVWNWRLRLVLESLKALYLRF